MRTFTFVFAALVLVLVSCSKREIDTASDTEYQYNYFPLRIGQVLEYQLDSLVFELDSNGMRSIDSISVRIEDRITDTLRAPNGDLNYIIVRSELQGNQWQPVRTMQAGRDGLKHGARKINSAS